MKNKHIYSSASSAYRWMNCTKSTELVQLVPDPGSSEYAIEGTKAHEEMEAVVDLYINKTKKLGKSLEETMDGVIIRDEFKEFLDHLDYYKVKSINLEKQVGYLGIQGTLDYSWYQPSEKTIHIRDLKWGEGQEVEAIGNAQMAFYALAEFEANPEAEKVLVGIYQPRKMEDEAETAFNFWEMDRETLNRWDKSFKQVKEKLRRGDLEYKTGSWCSWCPAFPICPEYRKKYDVAIKDGRKDLPSMEHLTVEQVEEIAYRAKEVTKWLKQVETLAYTYALNGHNFKKLKLVNSVARRRYKLDEEATATELISIGVTEPWNKKIRPFGQIEKELGKGKIDHLLEKPEPGTTLVPIEDKRTAISLATAEDVFGDL